MVLYPSKYFALTFKIKKGRINISAYTPCVIRLKTFRYTSVLQTPSMLHVVSYMTL